MQRYTLVKLSNDQFINDKMTIYKQPTTLR
jgi:hypothetical protein